MLHHMATILVCYGGHFEPPKYKNLLIWKNLMKFDERNPKNILIPPFLFLWQLQQSFSNRFRFFLAYLVQLDVDVVPNQFDQFLFGE
jgi:hypothetical protein